MAPDPAYQPVAGASAVETANFYLLTLLRTQTPARDGLSRSSALKALVTARDGRSAAATTLVFRPEVTSLHRDALDPPGSLIP